MVRRTRNPAARPMRRTSDVRSAFPSSVRGACSPLENEDLYQAQGGTVTLQVRTDCAWAAMAFEPIA